MFIDNDIRCPDNIAYMKGAVGNRYIESNGIIRGCFIVYKKVVLIVPFKDVVPSGGDTIGMRRYQLSVI